LELSLWAKARADGVPSHGNREGTPLVSDVPDGSSALLIDVSGEIEEISNAIDYFNGRRIKPILLTSDSPAVQLGYEGRTAGILVQVPGSRSARTDYIRPWIEHILANRPTAPLESTVELNIGALLEGVIACLLQELKLDKIRHIPSELE